MFFENVQQYMAERAIIYCRKIALQLYENTSYYECWKFTLLNKTMRTLICKLEIIYFLQTLATLPPNLDRH